MSTSEVKARLFPLKRGHLSMEVHLNQLIDEFNHLCDNTPFPNRAFMEDDLRVHDFIENIKMLENVLEKTSQVILFEESLLQILEKRNPHSRRWNRMKKNEKSRKLDCERINIVKKQNLEKKASKRFMEEDLIDFFIYNMGSFFGDSDFDDWEDWDESSEDWDDSWEETEFPNPDLDDEFCDDDDGEDGCPDFS